MLQDMSEVMSSVASSDASSDASSAIGEENLCELSINHQIFIWPQEKN